MPKTYFKYLLPNNAGDKNIIYFPYWRYKGFFFSCLSNKISNKFYDHSYRAVESAYFPISVGLRSQALKLKFYLPADRGMFLKPEFHMEEILGKFEKRFAPEGSEQSLYNTHIGETLSLIYSPFYIKERKIFDGILKESVTSHLPDYFDIKEFRTENIKSEINFIPAICPNCGWDLKGERDSLVLFCKNCNSLWKAKKNSLKQIKAAYLPVLKNNTVYMPFWRVKTDISHINLKSYADLIKVANLPRVAQKEDEKIEFYFWNPAFKTAAHAYLRISTAITLTKHIKKTIQSPHAKRFFPVNLPLSEALESLKLIFANFFVPKQSLEILLPQINIKPVKYLLVYVPFEEKSHEYVNSRYNLAINKNQLKFAKSL